MTAPDDRDADPFTEALKQPDPDRFATPAELARMRADLRANATPEERAALEAIEGEEAKASPAPQALLRDPFCLFTDRIRRSPRSALVK